MANLTLTHSNATIYGVINPDNTYGDIFNVCNRIVVSFYGTGLSLNFKQDFPAANRGVGVRLDGAAEVLYPQAGSDYDTPTPIASGLTEMWHKVELNLAGEGNGGGDPKWKPGAHVTVTGTAPAIAYAEGFGRAYNASSSGYNADVYRLGPRVGQDGSGFTGVSFAGGYNGGYQLGFKTDAGKIKVFYAAMAQGQVQMTLYSAGGAITATGEIASGSGYGEIVLDTGLPDGVVREWTLGANRLPSSIATVGGTMSTKPAARNVVTVVGTSITVSAGITFEVTTASWAAEVGGQQLGLILGCYGDDLGVGGSPLIGSNDNTTGQDRADEVDGINPRYILLEHAANDQHAGTSAATFGAAYQTWLVGRIQNCSNLERIFCCPFWTPYSFDAAYVSAIQAAVAGANAATSTTKCVFIDTEPIRALVETYDGIHPTRRGARIAGEWIASAIEQTFVQIGTITPGAASFQVLPGARMPFSARIKDTGGADVAGYFSIVASVDQAGVSVGSAPSGPTDGTGRAYWTDAQGLVVASTVAVGTTFDVTLTAGGVSNTFSVSVVETLTVAGDSDVLLCQYPLFARLSSHCSQDSVLTIRRGDVLPTMVFLQDAVGRCVVVTAEELTAKLTDSTGDLVTGLTIEVVNGSYGEIKVTVDSTETALDTVTNCTLKIIKIASATNVAIFPVTVRIEG